MFAKALIFGRNESLLDALRNGLDRDEDAPFLRQFGHQPAIGGVDAAHLRGFIFREPAVIRQILREVMIGAIGRNAASQQRRHNQAEEPAQHAEAPAAFLFFGFGRGFGTRCLSPGRGALGVERLIGTQIRRSHDGGGIHGSAEKRDTKGTIRLLKSAPGHWLLGLGTGFQRRRALNLPLIGGFLATLAGLEQNLGVTPCPGEIGQGRLDHRFSQG